MDPADLLHLNHPNQAEIAMTAFISLHFIKEVIYYFSFESSLRAVIIATAIHY